MKQAMANAERQRYAPYLGQRPSFVLDRHPDGRHIALQVSPLSMSVERAAVWDLDSGRLVFAPPSAVAICWTRGGSELLAFTDHYRRDPDRPPAIVTDLQSEYTYTLARYSWPGTASLRASPIERPGGWCDHLAASPMDDRVAVTWMEQTEAGFFLVRLGTSPPGGEGLGDGYRCESNLLNGPVFSPNGRYLVAACSLPHWWAPDGDPETRSAGGRYLVGHAVIYDVDSQIAREVKLFATVPQGWLPDGAGEDVAAEIIGPPEFLNNDRFSLRLPTGVTHTLSVQEVLQ